MRPDAPAFRGAALAVQSTAEREWVLAGPAETGKTFACLWRLDSTLRDHPGSQCVMLRRIQADIHGSAVQTYRRVVELRAGHPVGVSAYGGEKPEWFQYSNGSRLWVMGMDRPGKALSAERDEIYVNQAEELTLDAWETLSTRVTGRSAKVASPALFGDCNPGPPHHWILHRDRLKVYDSKHEDNPTLYDVHRRHWTPQGERTLAALDALTGVRKERLRYGRWRSAEGAVYEFDRERHLVDADVVRPEWPRLRAIDFGYTNPFVCLWLAIDPDGRLYLYRELYRTKRIVADHAADILRLSAGETYEATVADHDAEDRETLRRCGVPTVPADKALSVGIQAVEARLANAGDGRPRLFLCRGALVEADQALLDARAPVSTEQEFDAYQWPKGADGRSVRESPVDKDNHGLDALRYAVMWADRRQRTGQAFASTGRRESGAVPAQRPTFKAGLGGRGRPTFRGGLR